MVDHAIPPLSTLDRLYNGADDFEAFHAALDAGDLEAAARHHRLSEEELRRQIDVFYWESHALLAAIIIGVACLIWLAVRIIRRWVWT